MKSDSLQSSASVRSVFWTQLETVRSQSKLVGLTMLGLEVPFELNPHCPIHVSGHWFKVTSPDAHGVSPP